MRNDIVISPGGKKTPCMKCIARSAACHVNCEEYKAWRAERDTDLKEKERRIAVESWTENRAKTCNEWLKSRGDWWKR